MFEGRFLERDRLFIGVIIVALIGLTIVLGSLIAGSPGGGVGLFRQGGESGLDAELSARERALAAETARWKAMAEDYVNLHGSTAWVRGGLTAAQQVEADRLTGQAGEYVNLFGSTAWVRGGLTAAQQVEADRLTGQAGEYVNLFGSTAWVRGGLAAAQQVEADRLTGQAGEYVNLFGSTARLNADPMYPVRLAEAARLTGLAIYYGQMPTEMSSGLASMLGQ
jgi:hypothetical protein